MKNNFHPELKEILTPNRFLMPYSTSHIGDILASFTEDADQQDLINQDLEFLSRISRNYCLSNDGANVTLNRWPPKELFDERVGERDLFKGFGIEKIAQVLKTNNAGAKIETIFESIKNIPLDNAFAEALRNPDTKHHLELMFPGLSENPTMGGFFKSFGEMMTRMNEGDAYKELRKLTQSGLGINRDRMFSAADPFSIIEKSHKDLGFQGKSPENKATYSPEWFNTISDTYIKLDMHGFQEDKIITKKGRKETFRNTTEDSFHAAFASTCNFYIISDNKAKHKTTKVFQKYNVDTFVVNPAEFFDYYKSFLAERPGEAELQIPLKYLNSVPLHESNTDDGVLRTYHLQHFVFDFFNKLFVTFNKVGEVTMIILSRFNPTNKKLTYHFEVELLSDRLFELFGEDLENLGPIKRDELDQVEWIGRRWDFGSIAFRLICPNGNFQLYYDFNNEQKSAH